MRQHEMTAKMEELDKPNNKTMKNIGVKMYQFLLYTHSILFRVKAKANPIPAVINKGNVLHRRVIKLKEIWLLRSENYMSKGI